MPSFLGIVRNPGEFLKPSLHLTGSFSSSLLPSARILEQWSAGLSPASRRPPRLPGSVGAAALEWFSAFRIYREPRTRTGGAQSGESGNMARPHWKASVPRLTERIRFEYDQTAVPAELTHSVPYGVPTA